MKRKFKVSIHYEVDIEDPGETVTGVHIMDALIQSQVGDENGVTEVKPALAFTVFETSMDIKEIK